LTSEQKVAIQRARERELERKRDSQREKTRVRGRVQYSGVEWIMEWSEVVLCAVVCKGVLRDLKYIASLNESGINFFFANDFLGFWIDFE